ncbi:hypothetical protein IWW36_002570 [Coemansia brasiliensis]|uniref:glycerophosphodiester phosphodiesterase n=1 Tax=Coemansia brasiliensis TaxID=2650707 RepID=A0A9W8M0X2_9FUNG|nr:hypothetical protein IWW36_002570 [Coemansia brasiliensis]
MVSRSSILSLVATVLVTISLIQLYEVWQQPAEALPQPLETVAWKGNATGLANDKVQWNTLSGEQPKLVGHRGEKAFMPEHSRASYWQAALEKADYIEPDLAMTKDGHLVVNHNEWLGSNTNVADIESLAHMRTNKTWTDNGGLIRKDNEWFIVDMTLEQLKQVRIRQDKHYKWRPQHFDGIFEVLTFEEYLQIVRNATIDVGGAFGVIPELKSPKLYNQGRSYSRFFEDRAILTMEHYGWAHVSSPVNRSAHEDLDLQPLRKLPEGTKLGPAAWQSFDLDTAEYLATHTSSVPVVALLESLPWAFTHRGLDRLSQFASIVSPWKDFFMAGAETVFQANGVLWNATEIHKMGGFISPQELVSEIHKRNMSVSPYTFYDSHQDMAYLCQTNSSVGGYCPADKADEFFYFFKQGVDFMFVENIVEANLLRSRYADKLKYGQ